MSQTQETYGLAPPLSSRQRSGASREREAREPSSLPRDPGPGPCSRRRNRRVKPTTAEHLPSRLPIWRLRTAYCTPAQTQARQPTAESSSKACISSWIPPRPARGPATGKAARALVSTRISERAAPNEGFGRRRRPEAAHCARSRRMDCPRLRMPQGPVRLDNAPLPDFLRCWSLLAPSTPARYLRGAGRLGAALEGPGRPGLLHRGQDGAG